MLFRSPSHRTQKTTSQKIHGVTQGVIGYFWGNFEFGHHHKGSTRLTSSWKRKSVTTVRFHTKGSVGERTTWVFLCAFAKARVQTD